MPRDQGMWRDAITVSSRMNWDKIFGTNIKRRNERMIKAVIFKNLLFPRSFCRLFVTLTSCWLFTSLLLFKIFMNIKLYVMKNNTMNTVSKTTHVWFSSLESRWNVSQKIGKEMAIRSARNHETTIVKINLRFVTITLCFSGNTTPIKRSIVKMHIAK